MPNWIVNLITAAKLLLLATKQEKPCLTVVKKEEDTDGLPPAMSKLTVQVWINTLLYGQPVAVQEPPEEQPVSPLQTAQVRDYCNDDACSRPLVAHSAYSPRRKSRSSDVS